MANSSKMSSLEIRSSIVLASIYALRMLGIFLILPVFAIYASSLEVTPNAFQIGLALGVYGLTQAIFQIPFGMTSDRFGRKKLIYFGLFLFIVGSLVAALSNHIEGIIIGRAIQGSGAISAVLTAFLSDVTRDEHRTKAMAIIGASIGLTFALSLVISPILSIKIGVPGIFLLMAILSMLAILVIKFCISEPADIKKPPLVEYKDIFTILKRLDLNRLNFGIFVLHATQISMFTVIPFYLIDQGQLNLESHWTVYLPILVVSFLCIIPIIILSERWEKTKQFFLFSIVLLLFSQILFLYSSDELQGIAVALLIYFIGFNYLEASLPSMVSRLAPTERRGLSLGVYNTFQSLGIFLGGFMGGLVAKYFGYQGTFFFCSLMIILWLILAASMHVPEKKKNLINL